MDKERTLPDGWKMARIGDIADIGTGGTPDTNRNDYYGGNVRWLKSGDVKGLYITEVPNRITDLGLASSNARVYPSGTVMLAMSGQGKTRGTSAILTVPSSCSQSVAAILPSDAVLPETIHFALSAIYDDIRKITGDNERTGLNLRIIRNIEIPLPPLSEQKRFTAILIEQLAAVEKARTATLVQLQAAKALPAAYLREVFESKDAREWVRVRLGEIAEITAKQVDPKSPEFGSLPHVNGENIESGTCRLTYLRTAAEEGMISGKYLFEPGDVLYSKLRPYLRKVVHVDFRGVCSADMYPIRVEPSKLDARFLTWLLVSDEFSSYADEQSRRARMPKLNREQLFAWPAPLPSLNKQTQINRYLMNNFAQVLDAGKMVEAQLAGLELLPRVLLQRAFRGEL